MRVCLMGGYQLVHLDDSDEARIIVAKDLGYTCVFR